MSEKIILLPFMILSLIYCLILPSKYLSLEGFMFTNISLDNEIIGAKNVIKKNHKY